MDIKITAELYYIGTRLPNYGNPKIFDSWISINPFLISFKRITNIKYVLADYWISENRFISIQLCLLVLDIHDLIFRCDNHNLIFG